MGLKRLDPKAEFKTVSSMDDAIDEEATGEEDMEFFNKTHMPKYLKFKDDYSPTYFIINNVLTEDLATIQEDHYKIELPDPSDKEGKPKIRQEKQTHMMLKYFDAGCREVEENGKRAKTSKNEWPLNVVQEMGSVVMLRSTLGDDEKKYLES